MNNSFIIFSCVGQMNMYDFYINEFIGDDMLKIKEVRE